jgi:hypothetical protein
MTHVEYIKTNLPKQKFFRVNFKNKCTEICDASVIVIYSHNVMDVYNYTTIDEKHLMRKLKEYDLKYIVKLSFLLLLAQIKQTSVFDKLYCLGHEITDFYFLKYALDNWNFKIKPKFALGRMEVNCLTISKIYGIRINDIIFAEKKKNVGDGKFYVTKKTLYYKIIDGKKYVSYGNPIPIEDFSINYYIIVRGKDNIELIHKVFAGDEKLNFILNEDPIIDEII